MQRFFTINLTLVLGIISCFSLAEAGVTDPSLYHAVYEADYKGLPISAKGIRKLEKNADGTFTLSSVATSFIAKFSESTRFKIEDGKFIPLHYEFHRSGIGKRRDAILDFNWQEKTVLNNVQSKPWTMSIPDNALDKLLYQLRMREDLIAAKRAGKPWPALSYQIADGGKMKEYRFEVLGEEVIKTPVGKLKTIKVERIRENKNRVTTFWLSPEYDFMLIKFRQMKENGSGFELNLKSAEFAGRKI